MSDLGQAGTPRQPAARRFATHRVFALMLAMLLSLLAALPPSASAGGNAAAPAQASATSLGLNGTTAYAEAPHAAELSAPNWTFELWLKDDNATYSHPRTRILTKGDIAANEVPYFASVTSNVLTVGARAGGNASTVT